MDKHSAAMYLLSQASDVPELFRDRATRNPLDTDATRYVRRNIDKLMPPERGPAMCAILMGPSGSGKTFAAYYAYAYWYACNIYGVWASLGENESEIEQREAWRELQHRTTLLTAVHNAADILTVDSHKAGIYYNARNSGGIVVLDDLVAFTNDYFRNELFAFLDWRYQHGLPTIITSNLCWTSLKAAVGPRMADRFREWAFGEWFDTESLRRQR